MDVNTLGSSEIGNSVTWSHSTFHMCCLPCVLRRDRASERACLHTLILFSACAFILAAFPFDSRSDIQLQAVSECIYSVLFIFWGAFCCCRHIFWQFGCCRLFVSICAFFFLLLSSHHRRCHPNKSLTGHLFTRIQRGKHVRNRQTFKLDLGVSYACWFWMMQINNQIPAKLDQFNTTKWIRLTPPPYPPPIWIGRENQINS